MRQRELHFISKRYAVHLHKPQVSVKDYRRTEAAAERMDLFSPVPPVIVCTQMAVSTRAIMAYEGLPEPGECRWSTGARENRGVRVRNWRKTPKFSFQGRIMYAHQQVPGIVECYILTWT